METDRSGSAISHKRGEGRLPAAPPVSTKLADKQVDANLAVERGDGIVVAGDLTVSVEIEDRRPGAVKRIEASTKTDAGGDFESQIESTLRRGRRVWPRIEEEASEARVVDEIVCGRRGIHVIMVHGVWLRPGAAPRSVRAI